MHIDSLIISNQCFVFFVIYLTFVIVLRDTPWLEVFPDILYATLRDTMWVRYDRACNLLTFIFYIFCHSLQFFYFIFSWAIICIFWYFFRFHFLFDSISTILIDYRQVVSIGNRLKIASWFRLEIMKMIHLLEA